MERITRFFIENNKFTLVFTLGIVFFGLYSLDGLNSESFPTVDMGIVIVQTHYAGASAEDIESKITKPIEDEIRKVRGLKEVKSVSQSGVSRIVTVADIDNFPVKEVISDLQRAIDRTPGLPSDLESPPSFLEIKSEEFPVIEVAIVGSNKDRLRDLVAYEVKEELEDNKDISSITLTGYRERQLNILLDKQALDRYHVGLNEVRQKILAQNVNIPGGNIEGDNDLQIVRIEGKLKTVDDLNNLVIRSNFSGEKVLLKDVAQVVDDQEDAQTLALYEGQPATLITISKKGGTSIVKLSQEVKDLLTNVENKYQGQLELKIFNDEGLRIGNRVSVLSSNGATGLVLVVFFLILFLPGRPGVMASMSLPLAILATFAYMSATGLSLNTITILALVISLGMLVDNAVVISENYARLKDEGVDPKEAATKTIRDLWLPITATALTTIAAFLPMLVTKGMIGQFIRGIPIVVTLALLISLAESFWLLPARLVTNKKGLINQNSKEDWFTRYVAPFFNGFVTKLIKNRYMTLGLFTFIIFGSLFMMVKVNKFILFPADQTEIYISRLEMPEGTRIENTRKALETVSLQIRKALGEDAKFITSRVGLSEMDFTDPKSRRGENVGIIHIFMTEEAKNNRLTNDILKKLRTIKLPASKDLSFEAAANGPPVGAPVTAIFRSNNVSRIDEVIAKVTTELEKTEGVFDIRVDDVYGADELHIEIDQKSAGRLGLDLATVGATVRLAVAGERLANVNLNNKDVNYFVRFQDKDRFDAKQLENINIMDHRGNLIPLSRVVKIHSEKSSPQIKRYDFKRAKTLTANINDEKITAVGANDVVRQSFAKLSKEYKDVSLEYGGEGERTTESMESLFQALLLSIVGIFALLVLLFKSYVRPLIILTTIPLGLVGVAVAFWFHDRPISFLSLIGVVGLGGIIVNSGIVLISFIEQLKEETQLGLEEILIKATGLRLRAVIVTSLTTVCGLLPTAYGIGGADEFIIPMTLSMAWGLTSGTLLALLWVPAAYAITEDLSEMVKKLFKKEPPSFSNGSTPEVEKRTAL